MAFCFAIAPDLSQEKPIPFKSKLINVVFFQRAALFVVYVQQIGAFMAHFFANQGAFWCNRYNFPKGGWPGSLEFQTGESLNWSSYRSPMFNLKEILK